MKWFQHDSNASTDAKIRRLILRHGAEGYAVYFHCLELIAGNISMNNITFELEHDSEIIADNLKIKGDSNESGIDKVNLIMKSIIDLGLFSYDNNKIFCFKLAQRLDNTVSRSPELNKIKDRVRTQSGDTTKLLRSCDVSEENRIDKIKSDKNKLDKKKEKPTRHKHGKYKNVLLTDKQYNELKTELGINELNYWIERVDEGIETKGYKYKNFLAVIRKWRKGNEKDFSNNGQSRNTEGTGKEISDEEVLAKYTSSPNIQK
jgi:hypothetical protein